MNKKNISKRGVALLAAVLVFVASLILLQATLTSGFKVETRSVNLYTDEGVNLSATLFVPQNATAATPAAGIVAAPGGNTPHTFYASYCIELSRRGYVVLAYDYYGTGSSDFSNDGGSGAVAAMKYLTSLSFVDGDRLGASGHSNGGAQAAAAITSEYAAGAACRSVLFIGCGIAGEDLSVYDGVNVGAVWGKLDEAGQGTFWDVYHQDKLNFSSFATMVGETNDTVQTAHWYADPTTGAARIVYTPNTFHSLSNIMPGSVTNILTYFDTTLEGNVSGLSPASHIYLWQELAVLLMAVSLCVMIFPAGSFLLELPFFASLKRPLAPAKAKANGLFWFFLLVPAVLQALIVKSTIIQGQEIMGKLPNLFKVQSTNGFVWWFFLSALIALAFFAVRMLVDKTIDRGAALSRMKTTPADLFKALLFGAATMAVPYLFALLGSGLTGGWYGRIFQTYMAPVSANRVSMIPVYTILFGVLFAVYAWLQADAFRFEKGGSKKTYLLTLVANALPALLFVAYIFGRLLLTHVTPITGREMSRANGAMMGMLLLYFVIAKVVTYFYKKTGNIYVCAMVNTLFVVWLSINIQQLMV